MDIINYLSTKSKIVGHLSGNPQKKTGLFRHFTIFFTWRVRYMFVQAVFVVNSSLIWPLSGCKVCVFTARITLNVFDNERCNTKGNCPPVRDCKRIQDFWSKRFGDSNRPSMRLCWFQGIAQTSCHACSISYQAQTYNIGHLL